MASEDETRAGQTEGPQRPAPEPVPGVDVGDSVGPYRLLSVIGEGGFGVVYEAEQSEPVRRRVALKVIKPGMDSASVVARFEAERQALAVMDHPCIAKVFDGGVTPAEMGSRPFFVMELVRGESITAFCDRNRLGVRDRVELFAGVCGAVQHAHNKGVIHRDLKPSNILVSYDGEGHASPKVIDFGIAKALNQRLTEKTVFTERGQMIGTPEYMSPEQAEMSGLDIDTRTDVYSLGVVLYELLTGVLPFDPKTLRSVAFIEIQRMIREVQPARPSTRLGTALENDQRSEQGSGIVGSRRTDSRSLTNVLRRDLDWVVMRCLEKDRERRYETPEALAEELRRYLRGEPVTAGPPSVSYRVSKFVRRHRAGVAVGALVLVALLLGAGGITGGVMRATEAGRREADAREFAAAIDGFLSRDLVGALDPDRLGTGADLRRALASALPTLAERLESQPRARAQVAMSVASALISAGSLDEAERWLGEARRAGAGDGDPAGAAKLSLLEGVIAWRRGDAAAVGSLREALARAEAELGAEDAALALDIRHDLASSLKNTAYSLGYDERLAVLDEADRLYGEVVAGRTGLLGAGSAEVIVAEYNRALVEIARGQAHASRSTVAGDEFDAERIASYERALAMLEALRDDAAALGERSEQSLEIESEIAKQLGRLGRWVEADEAYAAVVDGLLDRLGPGHWRTAEMTFSWEILHRRWAADGAGDDADRAHRRERALRTGLAAAVAPGAVQVAGMWKTEEAIRDDGARRAVGLADVIAVGGVFEEPEVLLRWADGRLVLVGEGGARREVAVRLSDLYESQGFVREASRWRGHADAP